MLSQLYLLSALCALGSAAPTWSSAPIDQPIGLSIVSDYFNLIANKVQAANNMALAPVCNLNNAQMPVASPTPLPSPSAGLTLKHVAVGRGIQNYTCGTNSSAAPTALGAVATLYNATCVASTYPDVLASLPNVALQFNLTSPQQAALAPSNLLMSGHHYFTNSTTPFFNLDTTSMQLGTAPCSKTSSVPAPADAPKGQGGEGNGAVAWLKLTARSGATGNLQEVYRVNTAGGNPPTTCAGIEGTAFEVQYAAEYWFYMN